MSWRDEYQDEDQEAALEMERARRADASRTRGPVTPASLIPTVPAAPRVCGRCGAAVELLRMDPIDGRRMVCVGRFDESGQHVDCFDLLDRQLQKRNDQTVAETREVIRGVKQRGRMDEHERRFLLSIPGGRDVVEALEKRFEREADKAPKGRGYTP